MFSQPPSLHPLLLQLRRETVPLFPQGALGPFLELQTAF